MKASNCELRVDVKELKRHPFLPPFFLPFFWGLMVSCPGFSWQTNFIFNTLNFYSDMTSGCPWLCVTIVICCSVTKLCLALCDSMDCSLPVSSVHGISLVRILEWVTISFYRGSSQPRDRTCFSHVSCIIRRILYLELR